MDQKLKRILVLLVNVIVISAVIVGSLSVFRIYDRRGKTSVSISVLPSDSQIFINDKKSGKNAFLLPGEYTITITREGFEKITDKVTVAQESVNKPYALTPASEEAQNWAKKNERLYYAFETRSGLQSREQGEKFTENNPITRFLPYRSLLFNIDYEIADQKTNRIRIVINARNANDRGLAVSHIRNIGFDPSDYEIRYLGFFNPLAETGGSE